jgi:hypothetical protein
MIFYVCGFFVSCVRRAFRTQFGDSGIAEGQTYHLNSSSPNVRRKTRSDTVIGVGQGLRALTV